MNTSPLSNIASAWTSLTLPAMGAVMIAIGLLMFFSVMLGARLEAGPKPKATKHRRSAFPVGRRADSNKEDFFDMVTRFRNEIDYA